MVSQGLKTRVALEKAKRSGTAFLPIFRKESIPEFANEILREDEGLRQMVMVNPQYRSVLEQYVAKTFKDYRGALKGAKIVDSWDRVTSAVGGLSTLANLAVPGLGEIISQIEDIAEEVPKAVYALYYIKKTGDKVALPYWVSLEAASHIPVVGDAIDLTNAYVHRARKITKEKVKKEMRRILPSELEEKVAA